MAGSFTFSSLPPALSSPAVGVFVCLYGGGALSPLPNIVCVRIDERAGPYPPTAQFTYELDDTLAAAFGWPSQVEDVWAIDAPISNYTVETDDRLLVLIRNSNGLLTTVFDGFAQLPQVDLTADSQSISFTAVGAAARAWDEPLRGSLRRNGSTPFTDPATGPVKTDLPCRFNPADTSLAGGGKGGINPNCTPLNFDVLEDDDTVSYPVFLTSCAPPAPGFANPQTLWTLSMACRYIMSVGNKEETYVTNPDFSSLEDLLQAYAPPQGSDVSNLASDQTADVVIRDYDASDKAWPDAIHELISYAGFEFAFINWLNPDLQPTNEINIYRSDALTTIAPKQVWLQPSGGNVGAAPNNAGAFHLVRDCNHIVNSYSIETPLRSVELSLLLAPLYQPSAADIVPGGAGRNQYVKSMWTATTTGAIRQKYRWYGMDELGEGAWNIIETAWNTVPFNFALAAPNSKSPGPFPVDSNGNPSFVSRYRKAAESLISLDSIGNPLKARLDISFNSFYAGPSVWTGPGDGPAATDATWLPINGGWELLPDRLGIRVTGDDPEQWDAGKATGKIAGISWWANPSAAGVIPATFGGQPTVAMQSPVLRLTTVIEDDRMLSAIAGLRTASPTSFTRHRRVDCRDHFQYNRVFQNSFYNTTAKDVIARDDTTEAVAHAVALSGKTEFPPVAGAIEIPFITDFYALGDRISQINGRNINLQMNVGVANGEAADFPFIVGRSFVFQPHQGMVLQLGDHRAEAVNL